MTEEDLVKLYQRGTVRRDASRADCVSLDALLAAVERRGPEEERLRSINHAMACADCGEELELLRSTRIVRDRAPIPSFGFALAASIMVVAGLGYYSLARSRAATSDDLTRDGTGDVQLVSPLSTSAQRLDSLVWRPVAGAASYVIDVRRDDGTLVTRGTTSDTTFVVPDSARVEPGSDVYWGVTARLSDGTELRSAARRIRIATP
jgi:hypothetical protein